MGTGFLFKRPQPPAAYDGLSREKRNLLMSAGGSSEGPSGTGIAVVLATVVTIAAIDYFPGAAWWVYLILWVFCFGAALPTWVTIIRA